MATVFVPADSKERSDESVIELTVPIEAEATGDPVAIVTSEPAPGMPAGLQLPASPQSHLHSALSGLAQRLNDGAVGQHVFAKGEKEDKGLEISACTA